MDLDMSHNVEVLTVSTSSSPGHSMKNVVPLQVELTKYPIISRDEGNKLRRPVRPIDRQRMRPWLMELLDLGNVFGLRWTNRHQGVFQISWRHASRLGWNLETDGDVFERWARHTGIYKEGDLPEPKRWKANFRCALHSLHDVVELTNAVERRGRNACRTYRFLQSTDEQNVKKKKTKAIRTKESQEHSQQKCLKEMDPVALESGSSEDVGSDTESEASHQDKVIVQTIDMKTDIPVEGFCLHHDHDYAGLDKTQKTIVLRQGVGSIMLHKEVQNAPDEVESLLMSNLDQLASAAMNSACIDSIPQQEVECDYNVEKAYRNIESFLEMPHASHMADSDFNAPQVSLRHLLLEGRVHRDDSVNVDKFTRKRKSLALTGDSFPVQLTESEAADSHLSGNKKTSVCLCSHEKLKCQSSNEQPPSQSTPARQRSGSPKILCRRSKRNKAKMNKCVSEPSEPLMSSCLLLLEAATRLDNAEKTGTPSMPCKVKSEKHSLKLYPESSFKTETNTQPNLMFQNAAKSNNELTPFELLRNTLENSKRDVECGGVLSKSTTASSLLKESSTATDNNAVGYSESTIIAAPYVTGLFSGVKIQSRSSYPHSCTKLEDDEGIMRAKGKLFVYEQVAMSSESATDSKSERNMNQGTSETVLPASQCFKKAMSSQFDTLSSVVTANAIYSSGYSPQTFVTAESGSLPSMSQIKSLNQKCIVLTSESQGVNEKSSLTTPVETPRIIVKEDTFLPLHKSEQMRAMKKSNCISGLASQNICISNSSGTENHATKSPQLSASSVVLPPPVQRIVTTASPLPAITYVSGIGPAGILPIYSQAAMASSTNSKTPACPSSKSQGMVPLEPTTNNVPSNYVLENCLPVSTDTSSLTLHEKDAFIYNPEKKVTNEIKLHVLPLTGTYSLSKVQTAMNKATCANVHILTKPPTAPRPAVPSQSNKTQHQPIKSSLLPNILQSNVRTVSVLPRSCQLTSTNNAVSLGGVKPLAPVILNGRMLPVDNVAVFTIVSPETVAETPSVGNNSAACDLIVNVARGKHPVDMYPVTAPSSNCASQSDSATHSDVPSKPTAATLASCPNTSQSDSATHTDVPSKPTEVTLSTCSNALQSDSATHTDVPSKPTAVTLSTCSNTSQKNPAPLLLALHQTLVAHTSSREDVRLTKEHDSLLLVDDSVSVRSLAELCKRHLAHLFSALDNHTSESEENDSPADSPGVDLIEGTSLTSPCKDIVHISASQ